MMLLLNPMRVIDVVMVLVEFVEYRINFHWYSVMKMSVVFPFLNEFALEDSCSVDYKHV